MASDVKSRPSCARGATGSIVLSGSRFSAPTIHRADGGSSTSNQITGEDPCERKRLLLLNEDCSNAVSALNWKTPLAPSRRRSGRLKHHSRHADINLSIVSIGPSRRIEAYSWYNNVARISC